ncbi:hypothetical protein CCH79_00019785 [Gambusia affinis]|uniref:Anion exchange protein n=1 Tax=Gambusia affinis TaxID=33528 RepID=A0A315VD94_GAMAF|nr:hypothetical protein CCH79_00019785 [Gambusia affinis]
MGDFWADVASQRVARGLWFHVEEMRAERSELPVERRDETSRSARKAERQKTSRCSARRGQRSEVRPAETHGSSRLDRILSAPEPASRIFSDGVPACCGPFKNEANSRQSFDWLLSPLSPPPDPPSGHRAVYVGVHVPLGRQSRRRHRHRGHRHHRRRRDRDDREDGRESPAYDDDEEHIPHDLFTELDELSFRDGEVQVWKETARLRRSRQEVGDDVMFVSRWLKFEEDVEDGGERWSKPYVATLSLHSLFELRSCIMNGTVLLDMRAGAIDEIADMVIDSMLATGQLEAEQQDKVREALLKRHHHQNEKKLSNRIPLVRSFADIGKKHSDSTLLERNGEAAALLPSLNVEPRRSTNRTQSGLEPPRSAAPPLGAGDTGGWSRDPGLLASPQSAPGNLDNKISESRISAGSRENSTVDFSRGLMVRPGTGVTWQQYQGPVDMNFMKKIPPGAEASNVLVGEVDFLERPIIAFVRLAPAVLLTGLTEVPVPTRFLFLMLGPFGKGLQYHEIGRSIATLMTDEVFHDVAYKAKDRNDLLSGIDEFLDQVTVLPPGEWDPSIRIEPPKNVPSQEKRKMAAQPNGSAHCSEAVKEMEHHTGPELQRTGRIFGGLVNDVRRKAPFYWSDIKDALSLQCLASVLFLYCACMSPVVTFGGLLGEATQGSIGTMESLFGASMTGVAYSLFAGQPLTILGSTGPVLVFEKILFHFCENYSLSYLSLRTSIGLWTAFLCVLLVATDASSLVCYITRFTEEAFAALICIIFIYEALAKLVNMGKKFPVNLHNQLNNLTFYTCRCSAPSNTSADVQQIWSSRNLTAGSIEWEQLNVTACRDLKGQFIGSACSEKGPFIPDVLFWSVILFFATFFLSSFLKKFKTKRYFPTKVRSTISDFAVFLTIMVMVLLDYLVGIPSPKLEVPERFEPTTSDRSWLVSPLGTNPWWTLLAAAVPALLCTILIFMDQQITAIIINRKENKLKKGCGYHLDLLVVAVMLGVCSILGLPWFVAATVLSISHVNSLKVESGCAAPGEQPKFLGIREQRVTGFMIFILMGCSVFMTSALKLIPMPVLYGVFLYMGVSSLKGIQLFDRIKLFGMPAKHQPDLIYLRYVPLWKVHVFTAVQLSCLIILWAIKASGAAVIFPMMDAQRMMEEVEDEPQSILKFPIKLLKDSGPAPCERALLQALTRFWFCWSCRSDPSEVNISDEMAKSGIWKSVSKNSEGGKALKHCKSQEKLPSIQISVENEDGRRFVDAETAL